MLAKIVSKLPAPIHRLLRRLFQEDRKVRQLYETTDYLSAYRAHTDMRVDDDRDAAIGGMWDQIGELQFNFMVANGLKRDSSLLDFGCGTLRGGLWYIRYLDPGNYTGIDISEKVLAAARGRVAENGLNDKHPNIILNEDPDSVFRCVAGHQYDFIIAQSVLTHLPADFVENIFIELRDVLKPGGCFFFTYWRGKKYDRVGVKDFYYPFDTLADMARKHGFSLEDYESRYDHPRGQSMALAKWEGAAVAD
ncbi:MAG: hypothetical protein CMM50_05625 [Rhodospirillaceae bacterium]|nr:hypothetical protein [Rhodospirillaceae bacterium]